MFTNDRKYLYCILQSILTYTKVKQVYKIVNVKHDFSIKNTSFCHQYFTKSDYFAFTFAFMAAFVNHSIISIFLNRVNCVHLINTLLNLFLDPFCKFFLEIWIIIWIIWYVEKIRKSGKVLKPTKKTSRL